MLSVATSHFGVDAELPLSRTSHQRGVPVEPAYIFSAEAYPFVRGAAPNLTSRGADSRSSRIYAQAFTIAALMGAAAIEGLGMHLREEPTVGERAAAAREDAVRYHPHAPNKA